MEWLCYVKRGLYCVTFQKTHDMIDWRKKNLIGDASCAVFYNSLQNVNRENESKRNSIARNVYFTICKGEKFMSASVYTRFEHCFQWFTTNDAKIWDNFMHIYIIWCLVICSAFLWILSRVETFSLFLCLLMRTP